MRNLTPKVWLELEHRAELSARESRIKWLQRNWPASQEGFLMFGGRIGVMLLEEAKYCFVHGQYLATTMLAFALLEQTIAGHLHAAGDDDVEHASGAKLLSAAKDARLITSKEWALLNKLRKSRNPIVHFRKPLALDGLDGRSFAKKRHPWALAEQDARQLLRATVRLVARPLRPET